MKRWLILVIVLIILISGSLVLLNRWYHRNLQPPSSSTSAELFRIEAGTSSFAIAKDLETAGLVRNRQAFNFYLFSHSLSTHMQAGLYRLAPNLPAGQVANIISSGQTAAFTATVNTGDRLSQIVAMLKTKGYHTADINQALKASYRYSILKNKPRGASLEGYLFPDTYRIEVDKSARDLIDLMIANTDQKITTAIRNGWRRQGLNLHQGLTISSIVEKETNVYADQVQVAQVYLKRLRIGMKLEANPTFNYAAAELGVAPKTTIQSPYNTYIHKGLPPTPLGAITVEAAQAVATPAHTSWLYFVADHAGKTHFAHTLEEHKRNVAKYLD